MHTGSLNFWPSTLIFFTSPHNALQIIKMKSIVEQVMISAGKSPSLCTMHSLHFHLYSNILQYSATKANFRVIEYIIILSGSLYNYYLMDALAFSLIGHYVFHHAPKYLQFTDVAFGKTNLSNFVSKHRYKGCVRLVIAA